MTKDTHLNTAWIELEAFASAAEALRLSEVRAIFSIGSLPGGYFRPGQSDLDVLVLFRGMPDAQGIFNEAQQEEKQQLEALAAQAGPYEMELIFLHESRLQRDPLTGGLPYADFVQRLLSQSKLLWGKFDLASLEAPQKEDIICAFRRYLKYFHKKHGGNFFMQGTLAELLKHTLVLMRTYLQVLRGVPEYDKTQLARRYHESNPTVPLPPGITLALEAQFAGEAPTSQISDAVRAELPAFHAALVEEMLRLSPE